MFITWSCDVMSGEREMFIGSRYYMRWRLKLKGETESICVCTKERKGMYTG